MQSAADRMKGGKASGIDGIPPEAIKEAVRTIPMWLLCGLNRLLRDQEFPSDWKLTKMVLILKMGKSNEDPPAFRPLSLLNTVSKLFEALIRMRLNEEIERKGELHENQYGFRKGRSTIQALETVINTLNACGQWWCVLVTLDVKNALNTASHSLIMEELRQEESL